MFYSVSPHGGSEQRNEQTVKDFVRANGISLPEKPHFITHMDECTTEALVHALESWKRNDCIDGVHEYDIGLLGAVTRLNGPKMDNASLEGMDRWLMNRGADRPPQPVISKRLPFQDTDVITIICFGRVLWTIHSGPSMPSEFDHELWERNALAYTPEELKTGKERCYMWKDMGLANSTTTSVVRHSTLISHFEGDEDKINDFLISMVADEISFTEYLKWGG